ncbi:MAG TPA: arginyl-tRNA synthetase [Pseudolysinimonas sp.]|nr:arginyl-tRNA synthetase [Pseudolysinimonas sp.]
MPGLRRCVVPVAVSLLALAALSGCAPTPSPSPSSTETGAASPGETPSASSTPSPTASTVSTPITIGCNTLITPDDIYAFNPNFGLITKWTPKSGSAAATAKSEQGIACRWQNQTSGDTIDVSVAHLDAASIESLKNAAVEKSTMVPTYGDEAYFSTSGGVGTAIVFQGNYWLVATSVDFLEPGDPADLITAALGALK